MRTFKVGIASAMALVGLCGTLLAAMIVEDTWSADEGWQEAAYFGTPGTTLTQTPQPVTLGGRQYVMRIQGGDTVASESEIYTTHGDFTGLGNYDSVRSIRFDFYADTTAPTSLELYFVGTGGFTWYYQVSVNQGWNSYAINMLADDDPGGWYAIGRTAANFTTDLGNVTEVGVLLAYTTAGAGQIYGLDSFQLNDKYLVPEPGTYAVLGGAFISLAFASRKRLNEMLKKLRS